MEFYFFNFNFFYFRTFECPHPPSGHLTSWCTTQHQSHLTQPTRPMWWWPVQGSAPIFLLASSSPPAPSISHGSPLMIRLVFFNQGFSESVIVNVCLVELFTIMWKMSGQVPFPSFHCKRKRKLSELKLSHRLLFFRKFHFYVVTKL